MAEIKWIKLDVNVFNNRKVEQLEVMPDGDGIVVIWLKLLCLAGSINDEGMIYFTDEIPYTEEMLATQFHRPLSLIKLALRMFEQFRMIRIIDNIIHISNWEKYQNVDRLSEIREYNRISQQNRRARLRLEAAPVNDMSMTSQRCHDTDIEVDIDTDSKRESTGAAAPTPTKKPKPVRKKHGEYGWPKLTDDEYQRLLADLGEPELARCIKYVDESAQKTSNKNKWQDWNLVIRNCSRQRWGLDRSWGSGGRKLNFQKYDQESQADTHPYTGPDLLAEARNLHKKKGDPES